MSEKLPEGFIFLQKRVPTLLVDMKYRGHDNIAGRPIVGYEPNATAILTERAAQSMSDILKALKSPAGCKTLGLTDPTFLIWDAYRPQMAVDDFWQWSQNDCQKMKAEYYPRCEKNALFERGYFVKKSSHSRGSTVDLTIVDSIKGPLDMGTPFDYMDEHSQPGNKNVDPIAYQNRQFLRSLMHDFGWQGITQEWWHFTLQAELFPETYFNFPVVSD